MDVRGYTKQFTLLLRIDFVSDTSRLLQMGGWGKGERGKGRRMGHQSIDRRGSIVILIDIVLNKMSVHGGGGLVLLLVSGHLVKTLLFSEM